MVLETGFQILHETGRITDEFDSIIMEDNSTILLEKGSLTGGNALLYEGNQFVANEAAGGRVMSESSAASGKDNEVALSQEVTITRSTKSINHASKNLLTYLYDHPFAVEESYGGIQMENFLLLAMEDGTDTDGDRDSRFDNILLETGASIVIESGVQSIRHDVIRLDGEPPIPAVAFLVTEDGENIVFEEETPNIGSGRTLLESSIFTFGAGQVINRNEKLLLSDTTNDQTIQLSEIGDIQITEIARKGRILQDGFEFTGQNLSQEVSGIALEEDGFILLDASRKEGQGINTTVFDAGSSILLENITGKQEKIILEEAGVIVEEDFSTQSNIDLIQLEDSLDDGINTPPAILLENEYLRSLADIIVQEDGTTATGGNIVLDGTDASSSDAGDRIVQEQDTADEGADRINHIVLESSNYIPNQGVKPFENFTMSGNINTNKRNIPIVQPAIITTKAG